jgi:hypothetical protein
MVVILRRIPGLVMRCSVGGTLMVCGDFEVDRLLEKTGLEGSMPSFFILCIQPPGCAPATTDNTTSMKLLVNDE